MKIFKKILLFLAIVSIPSCNFLDFDETDSIYDHDFMYKYFNKTSQMLVNVYSYMPYDLGTVGGFMRDSGCDDAECADPSASVQRFNNGTWSALATVDTQWNLYRGIRAANEFLESIKTVDFSMYENDPRYDNWMDQLQYFEYEARLLRAHYFFELAKRYGDIAIPLKKLTVQEANSIAKTPFADVISFIVSECDACAKKLPVDYTTQVAGAEYGRVTRGFAMAVKSKALLYRASKLHNPTMDKTLWKSAAEAARAIIDSSFYALDPGPKVNSTESKEIVLTKMNNFNWNFEKNNFPYRFTEGKKSGLSGVYPTQELVDAFQTIDGFDVILENDAWVSDDPNFNPAKPYERRDPRFAATVLADGMRFKDTTIETFVGGQDYSDVIEKGTPTGYYLRKYIEESTCFTPEAEVENKHHWVIYRYAETLLTYAEAMVEAFDNPDYTDGDFILSAREAVNMVRQNAGMPNVTASGKDDFIEALRREWRVEFAFEDHRFWDVRRWCIGGDTQTKVSGVKIEKADIGKIYTRTVVASRKWNDRMNLFPIPQNELFNNPSLNPQNKGW